MRAAGVDIFERKPYWLFEVKQYTWRQSHKIITIHLLFSLQVMGNREYDEFFWQN